MKKLLTAVFIFGLLTTPFVFLGTSHVAVVMADQHEAVAPEMIETAEEAVPAEEPVAEAEEPVAEEPAVEPEEEVPPLKLPWTVTLFWPLIVTALVGVVKAVSDYAEKVVPPPLWPIATAVLTAITVGLQSSSDPKQAIANVVAAVIAALGFAKTADSALGKWSTMKPADKAKFKAAIADGTIK
jgi:hypothetical protein